MSRIALNFIELEQQQFSFSIYRLLYSLSQELADDPEISRRMLPSTRNKYEQFWVSFCEQREGFKAYECVPHTNNYLTLDYLYRSLCASAKLVLDPTEYRIERDFRRQVFLLLARHPEGAEEVWLEPFFLQTVGKF